MPDESARSTCLPVPAPTPAVRGCVSGQLGTAIVNVPPLSPAPGYPPDSQPP
jgi:hypothetical protein